MTSLASLAADRENTRENARKSDSRPPAAKAVARPSAVRHGVNSSLPVLARGESRAKWDKFASSIIADLNPAGPLQAVYAGRIALMQWQLLRCYDDRRTLADQLHREAAATAPQTAWWEYRRGTDKDLPTDFRPFRRQMRELRRYQTLVARLTNDPQRNEAIGSRDAVALVKWAAAHLNVDDQLEDATHDDRFPSIGKLLPGLRAEDYEWNDAQLRQALNSVAAWAKTSLKDLLESLGPALKESFKAHRRKFERGQRELRRFRRCAAAKSTDDVAKFNKYEADLERRLSLALADFRRLQQDRADKSPPNPDEHRANTAQTRPLDAKPL